LVINGDIGYDLDSNNCKNYETFLVMLSKTAAAIPVIIATGNH
jgi:metallophosphoesterase superfamily enzyme